ncbi:hypothetical protein DFH09DRAFT_1091030 [Mycena vulgaris]|nr:hypothetical protein DFH09DRAFT_1091030 [Mycena vulgaris]
MTSSRLEVLESRVAATLGPCHPPVLNFTLALRSVAGGSGDHAQPQSKPTGDDLEGRGEALRCCLWALALHWPRGWWYNCKIARQWAILVRAPEYDMSVQARIPPAMAALHNFILKHDSEEWDDILDMEIEDPATGTRGPNQDRFGHLAEGPTDPMEKARSEARRDRIAQAMWVSYQELLRERGEELDE